MHRLAELLPSGVDRRADLVRRSSETSVERWTAQGAVLAVLPGIVVLPSCADDWSVRARAAVLWSGGALSHLSALAVWGAIPYEPDQIHVTVPAARNPRRGRRVTVHRTARRTRVQTVRGLRVTELVRSLVDGWALLSGVGDQPRGTAVARQAVIEAVRAKRVTVAHLRAESDARPRHRGRTPLLALLVLLGRGCQSELEVFGVTHVLEIPGLPPPVQQRPVVISSGSVFLDAAYEQAMVAVELDGAAFHGSRDQRERDIRRDTQLAAEGWVVLRFSYARLTREPEGCRREIERVVRARLALLPRS